MGTGVLHTKPLVLVGEDVCVVVVPVAVALPLVVALVGLVDVVVEPAVVAGDVGDVGNGEVEGEGFLAATWVVPLAFASADTAAPAPARPATTPQLRTTAQRRCTLTVRVPSIVWRPLFEPSTRRHAIDRALLTSIPISPGAATCESDRICRSVVAGEPSGRSAGTARDVTGPWVISDQTGAISRRARAPVVVCEHADVPAEHRNRGLHFPEVAVQIGQLHAFLAVADELSFRRAAARLYLSQPALSAQVRQLERELGIRLFDRDRTGTRLTPEGQDLVPVARGAVAAFLEVELAASRSPRHRKRLVCGVLAMGVGELTWQLLRTFQTARPDLDLTVVQLGFSDALPSLDAGMCDVVLSIGPFSTRRVHAQTVGTMPLDVMLPHNHPMSDAPVVPVAWLAEHLPIRPPVAMSRDWVDFWAMKELGGHPTIDLDPELTVSQLIRTISERGIFGMWPREAGTSPAVAVRPLDVPVHAPLQIVTTKEDAADVQQFLDLGRRLAAAS
jgi:DNA-binding transcriptional LysR family regulator